MSAERYSQPVAEEPGTVEVRRVVEQEHTAEFLLTAALGMGVFFTGETAQLELVETVPADQADHLSWETDADVVELFLGGYGDQLDEGFRPDLLEQGVEYDLAA